MAETLTIDEVFERAPDHDFLWIVIDSLALKIAEDERGIEYEIALPVYVVEPLQKLYPDMRDYEEKLADHVMQISLQEDEGLSYAFVRARKVFFFQSNVVRGRSIDTEHLGYSLGIAKATLHDQKPARILFALPEPPEKIAEQCPTFKFFLKHRDFEVTVYQWVLS